MTDPADRPSEDESLGRIDPSTAEGRSRLLLFGGLGWLAIGAVVDVGIVFWGGVAIVAGAFALNTAGKLVHYRSLAIPRADAVKLSASWLSLCLTVVALLATYAYGRYGPGEGAFFPSLVVGGVGFGLLHVAAQSRYLPATVDGADGA